MVVAATFCSACGAALPTGGQFCSACGAAVPNVAGAAPPASAPPTPTTSASSSAPAERSISEQLGVQNTRQFRVNHVVDGAHRFYRVTNLSGVALFTVGPPANEEHRARWRMARAVRPAGVTFGGVHFGSAPHEHGPPTRREEWGLDDFAGNLRADLVLVERPPFANGELTSVAGPPVLSIHVEQKFTKREFKVVAPDGSLLLEVRDRVGSDRFALHDGSGNIAAWVDAEVAAGGHSTYRIEIVGGADPVSVTVFAIVIDTFKGAK